MRPSSPPPCDTGFLSQDDDGRLRFGADAVRGWPWILDPGGIFELAPPAEEAAATSGSPPRSFAWEDLTRAGLRVRPTIVFGLLFRPWRDFEYRLEVQTRDGKGWYVYQHHLIARSDRRLHARALPAVVQFVIATPAVRGSLQEPSRVGGFLDELRDCLSSTRVPPAAAQRWPGAPMRHRRALDAAAVEVLAALDVVLYGGRPARGARVEADPELVQAVLAVWSERAGSGARPPSHEVVAAALDAMQGPRPDWPLDRLAADAG